MDVGDLLRDVLQLPGEAGGGSSEQLSRVSQRGPPPVAVEESSPELALEQSDLPADGGLRDVEPLPRSREAPLLGDGQEHLQLRQVHIKNA
jgi:hypothetical protein